jgi:Xaa-Pro aminopeptidase
MTLKTIPSTLAFPKTVYTARLEAVQEHDFFLCSSADAEWLTGVPRIAAWSEYDPALSEAITAGFVGESGIVFSATHSQWHLEAGEAMRAWALEEFGTEDDPVRQLQRVAEAAGWRPQGPVYVPPSITYGQVELLRTAFPDREVRSTTAVLGPLRARKDANEIEAMRDIARRTVAGIRAACERLRPGLGRLDLFAAIREEILARGAGDVPYGPDCWAIGPAVAIDWANAATKNVNDPIEAPSSVSLDVGASLRGYRADVGRTIWVGEAPARSAEALAVIAAAREAGAPLLTPGRRAHEVDDMTRAVIAEAGFGPGQWIPSGHGIGLEFHEPPVLGEADKTVLEDGNVVSFELAIWQQGVAGAFAEDTVVIRESGLEWLIDDGYEPLVIA